ncbi:MAG TPA: cysteine dioxygenase family protein [Candidatus Baltobacteraceae bacterium]|nr:cysteine dioxygenase family protein [Candidatus Baltobacteraceae bacterium]
MQLLGTDAALPELVTPIARAVREDRVTALAGVLAALHQSGLFGRELFAPARAERYSRRLIWRDPDERFVVVAMTWAPGQGSPLHDHAGLWGAEIVVDGTMSETIYELVGRDEDGAYRFVRGLHRVSNHGTVGVLIPPLEYHDFGNAGQTVAHSLHVYGGDLKTANAFTEQDDGRWSARRVDLRYDA